MSLWTATGKSPAALFHRANLLTYLSVLTGMFAVAAAKDTDSWSVPGGLIALSALLDMFDGAFARTFKR